MPRGIPNKPAAIVKPGTTKAKTTARNAAPAKATAKRAPRAMAGSKPGSTARKIAPAIVEKRARSKALSAAGTKKRA